MSLKLHSFEDIEEKRKKKGERVFNKKKVPKSEEKQVSSASLFTQKLMLSLPTFAISFSSTADESRVHLHKIHIKKKMSRPRLQEFFAEETQESKSEVKGKTQKKKKEMDCIKARMLLCHLITHTKKKNIKAVNLFFLEKKKFCEYIYI